MLVDMTAKQIAGYLKARKAPDGISFNDGYNKATYGITKAEFDEINRAMHAEYGMFPELTAAGVRKALKPFSPGGAPRYPLRGHAAKTNPLSGISFGQERTARQMRDRAQWERDQAAKIRAAKRPIGWEHLVEAHENVARAYEQEARKREHAESGVQPKRSHATRPTRASKETSVLPPSVRVARAGLASMREHGIKNLRYGLYRHAGDRMYQWGNFTGTPEHVITAVVPNARNTASQEALVRALKWKR
jgi:hypothetical protein